MADVEKILCPGCGAEMELAPLADFGLLYGFQYHCPRCGWDSPLMQTEREAREMAVKRNTTPNSLQKPLTKQEVTNSLLLIHCWIEVKGKRAFPEILDKDSFACYGKIQNMLDDSTIYYMPYDYGKAWRCWTSYPTIEERGAAPWDELPDGGVPE